MNSPKKPQRIGRSLGGSAIASIIDSTSENRTFTLKSGKTASFTRQLIMLDEITERTYVDPLINGRDQSTLTDESVSDITRTIKLQQFFPAIGRLKEGKIEILDGSRRRAACLIAGASLEVLVTDDQIDISDARQLAADIQTAREHNLRELGLRFKLMHERGMSKGDIAKAEGISNAKVTRAFQAASVPAEMIALFPDVSELTLSDYRLLLDVDEEIKAEGVLLSEVIADIQSRIKERKMSADENIDELKNVILSFFRSAKQQIVKHNKSTSVVTEKIGSFSDRNAYAKRKTNTQKRYVQYEFNRLPSAVLDELDAAIIEILGKSR